MNKKNSLLDNFRYERKFLIENTDVLNVEQIILQHPALFSKIFSERWINNIYYDHMSFNNFVDNIDGNMYRKKYRIRWYGNLFGNINDPILELKIKKGLLGNKKSFKLNSFEFRTGIKEEDIRQVLLDSKLEDGIKINIFDQQPVMVNRYKRKYYLSNDKKFRITIDSDQTFYKFNKFNNSFLNNTSNLNDVILELKYDQKDDLSASKITNQFPFRLTKSSKYAKGIEFNYF